jgi:hypothetical protein
MWGALSDERTGRSFTTAAGTRQRSRSRVRIPWDSCQYFTVSDPRFSFSSPPTTRRATVEVLDPASTRDNISAGLASSLYSVRVDPQKTPFLRECVCVAQRRVVYQESAALVTASSLFVSAGTCLPSLCLAMDVSSGPTILAFTRHVTVLFVNMAVMVYSLNIKFKFDFFNMRSPVKLCSSTGYETISEPTPLI